MDGRSSGKSVFTDAVEDRQDLGLKITDVEPLAPPAPALERPRVAKRAVAIARWRSAVLGDRTSSRRLFSMAALGHERGLALDELKRLFAHADVLVDQRIAHHAEQAQIVLELTFGNDALEEGHASRGSGIVKGLAQPGIGRRSSLHIL
jgi:hypothetical protein